MSARVIAILVAGVLGACASEPTDELLPGRYSGSTGDNRAVTIDVAGFTIQVNEKRTVLTDVDDNRSFEVRKRREQAASFVDRSRWECEPVLEGAELRCGVTWSDGRTETIELMKE